MQYPGPTLIVNEGDTVTVTLTNDLPVATSIVFPGQSGVTATGGLEGLLTREAVAGNPVTYTFKATKPGTYLYQSGTRPALQVEMGLFGALIVRPAASPDTQAYGHPDSAYDREYLLLLSEMDPGIHAQVAAGEMNPKTSNYFAVNWFINGRNAPDTMLPDGVAWLPTQPYGAMVMMHPGERVLMRVVNAGRDLHPFHTHGNNFTVIARDGRLLESRPGAGPDLAFSDFTLKAVPGATYDAIFEWTGKGLGWDIYGTDPVKQAHTCNGKAVDDAAPGSPGFDPMTKEYCPDHGKTLPVALPGTQDLAIGALYSGSPYLGASGALPPSQVTVNPNNGFFYMWHSHREKELTNFDIFPGGMMTMLVVDPHGMPMPMPMQAADPNPASH
jgi:FtsP/CotA-like multicopper oxidase with cupredoxin domain